MLSRRQFFQVSGAGLLVPPTLRDAQDGAHIFHIGVIADTHIIDDVLQGARKATPKTPESIFKTT